jgi:hypothetical protein
MASNQIVCWDAVLEYIGWFFLESALFLVFLSVVIIPGCCIYVAIQLAKLAKKIISIALPLLCAAAKHLLTWLSTKLNSKTKGKKDSPPQGRSVRIRIPNESMNGNIEAHHLLAASAEDRHYYMSERPGWDEHLHLTDEVVTRYRQPKEIVV